MRFKCIEISNYRQYKKLRFDFLKSNEHDLHIIIGQNGIGKTNILNVITWCLYGIEPHLGDSSKSLPMYNLEAKKELLEEDNRTILVEVNIVAEDNNREVTFKRTVSFNVETDFKYMDNFIVSTVDNDDNTLFHEGDDAKILVNRYMPEKIKEYFYFDGEQLNNYFLTSKNNNIQESVYAISQVDMLSNISERFKKVINKKEKEAGKLSPDIDRINNAIMVIQNIISQHTANIEALENQISISEEIIKKNSFHLQGQENLPILENKYQEYLDQYERLDKERLKLNKEIKQFIIENKIVLSFYPIAKDTLKVIVEKEQSNSLPPNIDKNLLEKMLLEHKCTICDRSLDYEDEKKIKNILEKISVSSETSHLLLNIKSELIRIIYEAEQYKNNKKNLLDRVKNNENLLESIGSELQIIDNEIGKFSDKDQVKLWHEERKKNENLLKANTIKLGGEKSHLTKVQEEIDLLNRNLKDAISKENECEKLAEIITFTKNANSIVSSVKKEMMDDVKNRMENTTTDYFKELVWKRNTYENITLDDNYNLDLMHVDGYSCVGSCSAAERSLLALSFTLALHEVSGFRSLLFIDTPVARVSDVNRINFANILKKVSKKKQIIMTFSPDEYSEDIRNIFETKVSSKVVLKTNEEKYTYYKEG